MITTISPLLTRVILKEFFLSLPTTKHVVGREAKAVEVSYVGKTRLSLSHRCHSDNGIGVSN